MKNFMGERQEASGISGDSTRTRATYYSRPAPRDIRARRLALCDSHPSSGSDV